ncbi:gliding motility protein GldN [Phaeodactylibacter sp.]|jgi:gliding motility associated protien GldN|uniref:type IX secretion system ring protein PorN/GldN n=1 Tax=Phaeodactylibacter sp. TaxID=1940289 RepID=UPI0025EC9348|nr:gliding motility protein GldN [Phaeodactylibacter sp.]MCI4647581.1 gliding motility protein GldN [Phaeodactylibacter sp.]MCI5094050.1 gliding motility protein GldN [Phaeodactylibacter sp.]
MKIALKFFSLGLLMFFLAGPLNAQTPDNIIMTESGEMNADKPLDDIVEKRLTFEKRVLPYDHIREADIFWEKRIWRVIDVREKMNLAFAYPERPFFTILMEAAEAGEITVYSTEDDKFSIPLTPDEVASMGASVDTIATVDPETYEETFQIVRNEVDPTDVKRYRLKEIWFFDEETSTMQVRILGIAPLIEEFDDNGNFRYERPMFWVYYPEAREVLARERVFNIANDSSPMSYEDLFEMRFFASYIYKESNVFDRRLEDYLSGTDLLMESERIRQEIFNFEHDLWSY